MTKFEEIYAPATEPVTIANNANQALHKNHREWREAFHAVKEQNRELVDENKEFERENQRLKAENISIKTLLENAKQQPKVLQMNYREPQQALPVVPECVGEYIEEFRKSNAFHSIKNLVSGDEYYTYPGLSDEVKNWISENIAHQELLVRAWLDGYTVEKPQLFEVKMPIVYWDDDASQLTNGFDFLRIDKETDEVDFVGFLSNTKKHTVHFTEQEIKSIDERYWQFAVPVEDGE